MQQTGGYSIISPIQAQAHLRQAVQNNPGPWEQHSFSVANNAKSIAQKAGLDPETAYVMGLLHDIGRGTGVSGIRHIFDGYDRMISLGEPEVARICLTHSFPSRDVRTYVGKIDCTQGQLAFLQDFLNSRPYDDYDRLLQLCDAISLPNGACILEKRLIDVALRHGVTEYSIDKWKAFMQVKKHFDQLCGCSIYSLLPHVLENSSVDLI